VRRRTSRQCAVICGIGRRRIRADMAWTDLSSPRLKVGGDTWTRRTKREAPSAPAAPVCQCCVSYYNFYVVSMDSHYPTLLLLDTPFLSFRLGKLAPPTYESDRQTEQTLAHFFSFEEPVIPLYLPRKCSGNSFLDYARPQKNNIGVSTTSTSRWQEIMFFFHVYYYQCTKDRTLHLHSSKHP
jgi:hypothetical protein